MSGEKRFTVEDAARANKVLRGELGKPPERFEAAQFVGMISDEVEALRAAGYDDGRISALLKDAGLELSPAEITVNYASPEERRR